MSDLHQHVFPQLVNLLDSVALDSFYQSFVGGLLLVHEVLLSFQLINRIVLILFEVHQVLLNSLKLGNFGPLRLKNRFVLVTQVLHLLV